MSYSLKEMDVVILCGGLGKRLKSAVGDRPKVLAQVNGKAFIEILINNLLRFGFKKFILCVGYQKDRIVEHFAGKHKQKGYELIFSEEQTPLGTGGALKNAKSLVQSTIFIVMNGDSFCKVDFNKLINFHFNKKALLTIVLARSMMPQDYGIITVDNSYRIKAFREKASINQSALVNAGIYVMQKNIFDYMPEKEIFSIEYDFFPDMINKDMYGYLVDSQLIDIGTPQRYENAQQKIGMEA